MQPVRLELHNFTAFSDAVLDFEPLTLAALVGQNGSGKSSLIDAMLFCLFGESTKGGVRGLDDHVRRGETECRVTLDFRLGDHLYQVIRHRTRGKKTMLELYRESDHLEWIPLAAKTVTDTQAQLEGLIRMDYRTFTASSLILQGKSDSLTADMTDQERKEVLARILGLDLWDKLQEVARDKARTARVEVSVIQRQLASADEEAAAVALRECDIATVEQDLYVAAGRIAEQAEKVSALEVELAQKPALEAQVCDLDARTQALDGDAGRERREIAGYQQEIAQLAALTERPGQIQPQIGVAVRRVETAAADVQAAGANLAAVEEQFRATAGLRDQLTDLVRQIEARQGDLHRITVDGTRIRTEIDRHKAVTERAETIQAAAARYRELGAKAAALDKASVTHAELDLRARELERQTTEFDRRRDAGIARLEAQAAALARQSGPLNEVPCGDDLQEFCPLLAGARDAQAELVACRAKLAEIQGQFNPHIEAWQTILKERDATEYDQQAHRRLRAEMDALASEAGKVALLEAAAAGLAGLEAQRAEHKERFMTVNAEVAALIGRRDAVAEQLAGAPVTDTGVAKAREAVEHAQMDEAAAREALARLRQSLEEAEQRAEEATARIPQVQAKFTAGRNRLAELAREMEEIRTRKGFLQEQIHSLGGVAWNLESERTALENLRTKEAGLREELGSLRRALKVAQMAVEEAKELRARLGVAERQAQVYEILDQACGKKSGVPALLIEAAVPQIERLANDVLGGMAGGRFAVRLDTQAETKAGTLSEVLRITVLDGGQDAPYQTFSGAEKFMVDLSLRIAITKFLSHRAGAEISLLVLDEGVACCDSGNRQAVMSALDEASSHFRKTLVVTHLAELQDQFPQRVEITRNPSGSAIKVIA